MEEEALSRRAESNESIEAKLGIHHGIFLELIAERNKRDKALLCEHDDPRELEVVDFQTINCHLCHQDVDQDKVEMILGYS